MENELSINSGSVLFIPHGGGPLPLFGDEGHNNMVEFLKDSDFS